MDTKTLRVEEIQVSGPRNWVWIVLGAALAALLGATLETGRLHAESSSFDFLGVLVRVITPNGDGRNDYAILCLNNPKDSAVNGTIYDLQGRNVAPMSYIKEGGGNALSTQCEQNFPLFGTHSSDVLTWSGRTESGQAVANGVYVWQIQSESSAVSGTVVVVR
ncbi:MAG: hypothetical protein WCU88_13565 [Elusimicrobiota bacterium]|jgi:hypothetical protein